MSDEDIVFLAMRVHDLEAIVVELALLIERLMKENPKP